MKKYPTNTKRVVNIKKLTRVNEKLCIADIPSTRMMKCASFLEKDGFIGWQMIVPQKGQAELALFGSEEIDKSDLEWIGENCSIMTSPKDGSDNKCDKYNKVYLLSIIQKRESSAGTIGFSTTDSYSGEYCISWPTEYYKQFGEIVRVLREAGAIIRFTFGKPSMEETKLCKRLFEKSEGAVGIDSKSYMGKPVRTSILMRLQNDPSIRMKSVFDEAVNNISITYLGDMGDESVKCIWDNPLMVAHTLPEIAARIMMMEPMVLTNEPILGIDICEKETAPIPASHENIEEKNAITIGKAIFTSGEEKMVKINDNALKMHWDVIGMSGTGKSSLLVQTIVSAIKTGGHGCTVFDPHGNLVDSIIRCVPSKYASKIKTIRLGDSVNNPVPIRVFRTDDIDQEEQMINNVSNIFQELFDPNNQGFVGPRFMSLFTLLCKASIALGFGGTFQSILAIALSKDNIKKAVRRLRDDNTNNKYTDLIMGLNTELLRNNSNDYNDLISWFSSKFRRLVSTPELRNTFGTTVSALDFMDTIDTDQVLLIDLASPAIGTDAAKMSGILILNQLWDAVLKRKQRDKNHIIVVDEAHLFSGGGSTLNRILYEGRKFGVSLIMAHQNCAQLSYELKEAVAATANFSSFRLSVKDASEAAVRFDNASFSTKLCRLKNLNAVTSISVNGNQSEAFTLSVPIPTPQKDGETTADIISKNSIASLVDPFREYKPVTASDVNRYILFHYRPTSSITEEQQASPDYIQNEDESKDDSFDDKIILDDELSEKDREFIDKWNVKRRTAGFKTA